MSDSRITDPPQQTALFRAVAFLTHIQLGYLLRGVRNPNLVVLLFVTTSGMTALGTIALTAFLTNLPLLFPPLGPSAFILFRTPMSQQAAPRAVILSHLLALCAGLIALQIVTALFPGAPKITPGPIGWTHVLSIGLAMGLVSMAMLYLQCSHPPAAATALIAAMGILQNPVQVIGLAAAVVLLVAEAFFFNRVIGGLPYPVWRSDPATSREFGTLAGAPDEDGTFWGRATDAIFRHRTP